MGAENRKQWIETVEYMQTRLLLKEGETWSPYGFWLLSNLVSEIIGLPSSFAGLERCKDDNLLHYLGALKDAEFNLFDIKEANPEALQEEIAATSEALRGMITPELEVGLGEALFWSAISLDFGWQRDFKQVDGQLLQRYDHVPLRFINGGLYQRIPTQSSLVVELLEKSVGIESLLDGFTNLNDSHDAVTIEESDGAQDSSTVFMREWEHKNELRNVSVEVLGFDAHEFATVVEGMPFSMKQEVVAKFKHDGYSASALTVSTLASAAMMLPRTRKVNHYTVDWNKVPHYCICRDLNSGAVLFISDVPAL